MRFTSSYREPAVLGDGTRIALRLIRPDDKQRLRDLHASLSPTSRALRFFMARGDLQPWELRYFTEVDHVDHVALLAEHGDETLGVARFVRLAGGHAAEPALAVADQVHGRGLGRLLLSRLVSAARERGVVRFDADVLPHNGAMLRLLRELDPTVPWPGRPSDDPVSLSVALVPARDRRAA